MPCCPSYAAKVATTWKPTDPKPRTHTMRFSEIHTGQVIHCGPARLSEQQITDFARDYDPQWFHTDAKRAAASTWKGLIASGWQTCAVAMRLACDEILAGSESFGSPGLAYLKWENPVRPDDTLSLRVDVLDLEATSLFDLADNQSRDLSSSARA